MNSNTRVIYAKRIKSGSLAALVFSGTAMLMIPMCLFFGVLAFFGAKTVHVNGSYVTGIGGFLLSLVYGPLFTGIIGLFAWTGTYLAMRLVGHFRPYRIEYVDSGENTPTQ
ncbi:MAG: hypothetical protein HZA31_11490 [Opitutae bacterium]|nr:hypothetical protein [Opitutae bacterium]